jgi:hypothetical protein
MIEEEIEARHRIWFREMRCVFDAPPSRLSPLDRLAADARAKEKAAEICGLPGEYMTKRYAPADG